jgi:hypothetical protein
MGFFSNLRDKFSEITRFGGKKSNKSSVELQYDKAMSLMENANGSEAVEILEGIADIGFNDQSYKTIGLDALKVLSEYFETGKYDNAKTDLVGIRVDREPTYTAKRKNITSSTDVDDIEEVRLSSQFVVEDKYMSDASSEGFYLYLWKDNFLGTYPQNIYMKVEFNHAGYGRTIPFMCPFKDPTKNEGNGFKSFSEILDDWSSNDKKYGIVKYSKYSYIHFKYKYDKISERHVYYLDDKFYGTEPDKGGVHFEDNAITINLYEAKIV